MPSYHSTQALLQFTIADANQQNEDENGNRPSRTSHIRAYVQHTRENTNNIIKNKVVSNEVVLNRTKKYLLGNFTRISHWIYPKEYKS